MSWWMRHYGAPTPKRHYLYANSNAIHRLDKGQLTGWKVIKAELKKKGLQKDLVEKYVDSKGVRRWKGSAALRSSESGPHKCLANK